MTPAEHDQMLQRVVRASSEILATRDDWLARWESPGRYALQAS